VVELKNPNISFTTINTRMGCEKLCDEKTITLFTSVIGRTDPVFVARVVAVAESTMTGLAELLKSVSFTSIPAELRLLLLDSALAACFQMGGV
jgi:hypothetical protein